MKRTMAVFLFFCLCSCRLVGKSTGIVFKIENKSDSPITAVKFTTSEGLTSATFDKIDANQSVSGYLSMEKHKVDGSYVFGFTRADAKKELQGYGYYTNGAALDRGVVFVVEGHGVLVAFDK
jgi:hypothetical protein